MKPDYLSEIDEVARNLTSISYDDKLILTWNKFEVFCAELNPPYDILHEDIPGTGFLQLAADFVRLLSENNDSSPVSDCDQIREKDAAYGGSWHSRGGTGAFHALARKGDRLVSMLAKHRSLAQCRADKTNSESIDDTIGDLRRYLILVLAWFRAKSVAPRRGCPVPGCVMNDGHGGAHEIMSTASIY